MSDCATQKIRFETPTPLALEAAFDGGRLTSDGGSGWLARMDSEMGLCRAICECVPEWRTRKGRHTLLALLKQRVFQIACGYEDQNDSDSLREDPLLKVLCGSLPESGAELASQPTISLLENAADRRSCHRIGEAIFELYLKERGKEGTPERVVVDFDSTEEPTPKAIRKGATTTATMGNTSTTPCSSSTARVGHLICALLRAGNTHSSRSAVAPAVALLKRIVARLRHRWPGVEVELRAEAGFAVPALYEYCEQEGIT